MADLSYIQADQVVSLTDETNTLSITAAGAAKVDGSAVTQPVNLTQVSGSAVSLGQALAASSIPVVTQADSSPATQNITAQDSSSVTTSQANSQSAITGTPTAGSAASFAVSSFASIEVQVTGTWTGTLQSELSFDGGTTWFSRGLKQSGISYISLSFTANFQGGCSLAGATNYRIRSSAAWTGTATVKIVSSVNLASVTVSNPVTLRDGTTQSIVNTIKAASTAAAVADTALVIAPSPNTPLPAGTNAIGTVTANQGTANATPWNENIAQWGGAVIDLGQENSAGSVPVVIASDQTHFPVELQDGSGNAISSVSVDGLRRLAVETQSHIAYATSQGQVFSVVGDSINAATAGTDNPLILIKNPNASGKTLYIHKVSFGTGVTNRAFVFEMYADPTITSNGTAATIANNLIGNGTASVATAFTLPTATSNGTILRDFAIGQNSTLSSDGIDFSIQVPPNHNLLITGNPSSNGTTAEIFIVWLEE